MKYRFPLLLVSCAALLPTLSTRTVAQPAVNQVRTDVFGDPLPEGALARLGSVRFHHECGIIVAAFSPDGKTLLAAGLDKKEGLSLRYWEIGTGKEINRSTVKGTDLTGMTFAPDGKTVFLGRYSGVEQYDRQSGKLVQTFAAGGHFAVSPDGKWLATFCDSPEWSYNPIVHIWEIETGKKRAALKGQRGGVVKCQWSADSKRILSASSSRVIVHTDNTREEIKGSIYIWEADTGRKLYEIGHDKYNLAFAPDGQTVALQSDMGIQIVNVATGKTTCVINVSSSSLEFTSDSKRLVTVNFHGDEPSCLWDAITGKQLVRFENQGRLPATLVSRSQLYRLIGFSPDRKMLAATAGGWNADGSVLLWNVATGEAIHHNGGHFDSVTSVAFAPDSRLVASGSADSTVRLWDPKTGKQLAKLDGHKTGITTIVFTSDSKKLASASGDGQIRLWDLASKRELARLDGPEQGIASLGFSPDGRKLFVGGKAHTLQVWDLIRVEEMSSVATGEDGTVFAISRDGQIALSANGEERDDLSVEQLHLWKLPASKPFRSVALRQKRREGDQLVCWTGALSADGHLFAAAHSRASRDLRGTSYADHTVCVYERLTGQEWMKIPDIKGNALAFSHNGRFLAVGHGNVLTSYKHKLDSRVTVWDMATGDKVREWKGHANEVTCVAFSGDGNLVASASADHTILIWRQARPARMQADADEAAAKQIKMWWDELGRDLPAGQAAVAQLVAHPRQAVKWIGSEVKPASPSRTDPQRIAQLIEALDCDSFKERQEATAALEALGVLAEAQLQKVLVGKPSLETRVRVEQLLARLENVATMPERLRTMRALLVLEWIGSAEAEEVLATLRQGAAESDITQLAQAALARMRAAQSGRR
jgi:WD40 repeat protein